MTTVFSALPMSKGEGLFRSHNGLKALFSSGDASSIKTLTPVDQLPSQHADEVDSDITELNDCLAILVNVFPDIQTEVFREMLSNLSRESRVEVVTEHILRDPAKWIKGRYRKKGTDKSSGRAKQDAPSTWTNQGNDKGLAIQETFRSKTYRNAVKQAFYQEFKGLTHSTIKAVLAERNFSYLECRPMLLELASQSWRHYITSIWSGRRNLPSDRPTLVESRTFTGVDGEVIERLVIRPTMSHELNREIYDAFVAPSIAMQRESAVERDALLALTLNEKEAEQFEAMYDCECCYCSYAFEQIAGCDVSGHYICFRCIQHAVKESLFGQGWARNISAEKMTVRCLASSSEDCTGCVSADLMSRALLQDKDGKQVLQKLHDRIAADSLMASQLPLLQCPFCTYAEVDDVPDVRIRDPVDFANKVSALLTRHDKTTSCGPLLLMFVVYLLALLAYPLALLVLLTTLTLTPSDFSASRTRLQRRRRGLRFRCCSPLCSRASCTLCSAPWIDPHVCHETSTTSLRHAIEAATTQAVKRTCPKCQLSFVKSSGCNKLVCNCGYAMCYVCRNEIGKEGYAHFCQHFRERGGRCSECERCDLYVTEDEDKVVRRAAEKAEREWREAQAGTNGKDTAAVKRRRGANDRLRSVREEVLTGTKYEDRWRFDVLLDALVEALMDEIDTA